MAGVALILRYQWRSFWRRLLRTGDRAQFYLMTVALLAWIFFFQLPPRLSHAANELAAGRTSEMDAVLWLVSALWLFVVFEDAHISLTSQRLLTFPLRVGSLLAVRVLSLFCSPVVWLLALGSVLSLFPFFFARHALLGSVTALWLFALALTAGFGVSHVLSVAGWRRKLLVPVAIISVALGALVLVQGRQGVEQLRIGVGFSPPGLVTAVAVAATPSAAFIPLITLLGISAPVCFLFAWSFRRSLFSQKGKRSAGRAAGSVLWLPGRFGGLVRKEQYYFRKVPDLWMGVLLVLAVSTASLFGSPAPIISQVIILVVFAFNANLTMNCLGVDTATELNRYFVFPLRGKDILLVKNLALMVIVTAQLSVLILAVGWRSGVVEAFGATIEAAVLLLSHLAWGNLASVDAPFKMPFYRFANSGEPLTALVGVAISSVPGVAVIALLHSDSTLAPWGIALTVAVAMAAYLGSLHAAGKIFERRRQIICERLS